MQEWTGDRTLGSRPRYRTLIFAAFASGLAVVSALGVLDEFGQRFVADTTTESIGILLVSMGFDAGVSALQDLPVVGAGLDPINDAVERLSTVIVWAIGSLLLQRTALELVSSAAFQWGFVAICAVAVPLMLLLERRRSGNRASPGMERLRGWLVRIVVVAAMVRFFVPAFLAVSATVSNVVLQAEIDEHRATLEAVSAEIFGGEDTPADGQDNPNEPASGERIAAEQDAAAPADEALSEGGVRRRGERGAGAFKRRRRASGPHKRGRRASGSRKRGRRASGSRKRGRRASGSRKRGHCASGPRRTGRFAGRPARRPVGGSGCRG